MDDSLDRVWRLWVESAASVGYIPCQDFLASLILSSFLPFLSVRDGLLGPNTSATPADTGRRIEMCTVKSMIACLVVAMPQATDFATIMPYGSLSTSLTCTSTLSSSKASPNSLLS